MSFSDLPAGFSVVSQPPRRQQRRSDLFDLEPAITLGREYGTVTSTVRDPARNRRVGGAERSYHLPASGGRALDIARRPGVSHADIEAAYLENGAELIESLDEGDHSHFAFRIGPRVELNLSATTAPQSDIPPGFEVVSPGPSDPKADRIATIKQNGFPPAEEAELIRRVQAEPAPLVDAGRSVVAFKDEMPPEPSRKMTAQEQAGLLEYLRQPNVTADMARAYADRLGFSLDNAADVIKGRDEGLGVNKNVLQRPAKPRDTGTGRTGAMARAVGNALTGNLAGEIQGLGNTTRQWLEGTIPEGRSFSDQWGRNNDFFEGAYEFDRKEYPVATFGTELAASALIPFGSGARGVGQLGKVGGAYGAVYGFGEGEGGPLDRAPGALGGALLGGAGGAALGKGIDLATPFVRRASDAIRTRLGRSPGNEGDVFRESAYQSAPVIQDGFQGSPGAKPGTAQGAVRASKDQVVVGWRPDESGAMQPIYGPAAANAGPLAPDPRPRRSGDIVGIDNPILGEGSVYADPSLGSRIYGSQTPFEANDNIVAAMSNDIDEAELDRLVAENAEIERRLRAIHKDAGPDFLQGIYDDALRRAEMDGADLPSAVEKASRAVQDWWQSQADNIKAQLGAERRAAMRSDVVDQTLTAPVERQRDYLDIPSGWSVVDDPRLGRTRPMGQQASPEDMAAAARNVLPEDVVPIPSNVVDDPDQLPSTIQALEPPRLGRRARKPSDVLGYVKGWVQTNSSAKGMPVRIDAEDAIDKGVPADLIYSNPNVADRSKLRLRNPSIFGTRYGAMTSDQQQLRSLDQLDLDPVAWGYDDQVAAGRLEPEDVADLLRRGLEGDESALNRADPAYGPWSEYQERAAQKAEFEDRFPDGAFERVGEPISMDDLDALTPPATAYEDLPKVGGNVANINIGKLETRGDIRRALQATETRFGGFDAARRGKITQAETEALAAELKMTPDDLLRRRKGQALNAEQALAARQILAKSADELVTLAGKVKGGSDEDVTRFQRALLRHAAIQEQVTGATAEAGRALSQFKMAARSKAVRGRVLETAIEGGGGRGKLEDAAEAILDLQRRGEPPAEVNETARLLVKPKFSDKLVELWYNSLLSGPQTHVVNVLSNAMTAGLQLPEQATAAALGLARRGVGKARGKADDFDRVLMSELGPRAIGLMQGAREGLGAFARTLKTGEVPDFVTKVEARTQKAIPGRKGEVIRVPSRLLAAEDEFFKATARRMELGALAVRKARSEGLRGDALKARIAALNARPTDDMIERSLDYARYLTYQRPLGQIGSNISGWTRNHPWMKLFVPFIRTPTNIIKFVVERSPAAPLLKEVQADLKAGGERRDLALAKVMLGTGFGMIVAELASRGYITGGGPADQGAKDLLRADGWQPYSVKVGDKYYSYQRLDPLASTMGIAADLVDRQSYMTASQQEKSAELVIASVLQNMSNKTWLSGAVDLAGALDDPERNLQNLLSRVAGSVAVPTLVAQTARTLDPVQREAKGPLDRIISRIPGLSQRLEAKRDVWGEPIKSEGGVGPDFVSPIWTSTGKDDPLNREMLAIGGRAGRPSKSLTVNGEKRKLTPAEYGRYQALSGRYMRQDLQAAMADPEWKGLAPPDRKRLVETIKKEAREAAREELFEASDVPPGWQAVDVPTGWQVAS